LAAMCAGADQEPAEPLIIAQDHAWAPLAFENQQGEPQGLLVDLWRAVGKHLGREVVFELGDWQAGLDRVRDQPNRIHGGLFRSAERAEYMDFSSPLMPLRTTLFVNRVNVGPTVMVAPDLGDTAVGTTAGGYEQTFLRENYPELTLRLYDNNQALVQAAARGQIDAFVADYPVGMYYLDRFTTPDHFHVLEVLYQQPLHAAVAKGNSELLAEIERGLAMLSDEQLTAITQKWMHSERVETLPPWLLPLLIFLVAVALLGGFALHYLSLKRQLALQATELLQQAQHQRLLTDNMTDFIWTVSPDNKLSYVSPSVEKMLGYTPEELIGQEMTIALTPESAAETYALQTRIIAAAQRDEYKEFIDLTTDMAQRHKNGTIVWTEVIIRSFFTPSGDFAGAQGASRDITERIDAEKNLRQLASLDPLTQLPNRWRLLEDLQQVISHCRQHHSWGALLYMDLDNFKQFNDYQGHLAGDRLLRMIAKELNTHVPEGATLARYSGDGFMLVVPDSGSDKAAAQTQAEVLANNYLAQLSQEFDVNGTVCRLSSSMGVVLFNGSEPDAEKLIKRANQAMHQAKTQGRNRFYIDG
ncbi:MAG TPA: diguanylate cyclase, partial [Cellvibrionaceae bacterium]